MISLEISTCASLSLESVNSTQDFTTSYSLHMLKQHILQGNCVDPTYVSNISRNYVNSSLSMVNNALCCTEDSFNQDTLNSVSLVGYYDKVTLNCNNNPKQSGRKLKCFIVLNTTRRGHGGRVVTLPPPTSEAGVRSPSWSKVGKLVVDYRWSAVYSTEP